MTWPERIPRRWWIAGCVLALAVIVGLLVPTAYRAMFISNNAADDSGYVLISLREFFDGLPLYDEVYSSFGPGFYVLVGGALTLMGIPFTADGARFVDMAIWLSSTFLIAITLLRLTRSFAISAAGLLLTFYLLSALTFTPLHPLSSITLILAAMACAAALLLPDRPRAALATLGALAAVLLSIKVNVGVLALAAIAFAIAITSPWVRSRPVARIAACLLLVVIPFPLLSRNLDMDEVVRYAVIVSLGSLAFALVADRVPVDRLRIQERLGSLLVAVAAVAALVIVVPILSGTSVTGLAEGVVLDPLDFPDLFTVPLYVSPFAPVWGALAVGAALIVRWRLGGEREPGARERALFGALRAAAGLGIWILLAGPTGKVPNLEAIVGGAALAWVAAVPGGERRQETSFFRALICGLAILQLLHGYPVAGNQLGPSQLLLVIVGGLCISDGLGELYAFASSVRPAFGGWRVVVVAPVIAFAVWLAASPVRNFDDEVTGRFDAGAPLQLPGAERTRYTPGQRAQLRGLVEGIRSRCSAFITMPGMNSLYLYTEQDPPTGLNGTHWMWLFDSEMQQEIVDRVKGIDGLCAVVYPLLTKIYGLGEVPDRPLVRYIDENFTVVDVFAYGGYYDLYRLETKVRSARDRLPPAAPG